MGKKKGGAKQNDPDNLKDLGNQAYQKKDLQLALQYYTEAISKKEHEIYYSNRAQVYIDLKRFEEAIEDCDKAIAVNKVWLKAYIRKAIAHRESF